MHKICLKVSVAERLSSIPPPQQVRTQPNTRLILETDRDSIKPYASHAVEVIRSDGHLPASNVEGVGSIPPPLNQGLCQDSTGRPLEHQTDDWLETHNIDIALRLLA